MTLPCVREAVTYVGYSGLKCNCNRNIKLRGYAVISAAVWRHLSSRPDCHSVCSPAVVALIIFLLPSGGAVGEIHPVGGRGGLV